MSNRNFDSRVIIQRLQNQVYSRNLYTNNVSGLSLISNPQNTDSTSSRFQKFIPGSQTDYFRGLLGAGMTSSIGGIVNIPPFITSPTLFTLPSAPTITSITAANQSLVVTFNVGSNGGTPIINYLYSIDGGATFTLSGNTNSPIIITGLTNGISYDVQLRAVNMVGNSPISNTVSGTPVETIQSFTTLGLSAWLAPEGIFSINYLIVGGGGGSGGGFDTGGGGGGGAGTVLTGTYSVVQGTTYSVTVGDGGIGGISIRSPVSETNGSPGENSAFDAIVALGGGGGYASRSNAGIPSGGGSAVSGSSIASIGGSGGGSVGDGNGAGGGGGGNTSNGNNGVANVGGTGGNGVSSSLSGSSATYGVGGRGANGNQTAGNTAVIGSPNTGNGARGGGTASGAQTNGAKGGSGIVIIQY